ncbi:MAG: hypothetical protein RLZZ371_1207 [Pseudomonadota bacterium]
MNPDLTPPDAPLLVDDSTPQVRVITLNRPHRLNALDGQTLDALIAAIHECGQDGRDIRVIVIRGNGRAFCTGNDLKWLASGVLTDTAAHLRHQDRMQQAFEALEGARQIVIASVHGHAVAGGFELALAADILVVANDAQLGDAHLKRNLLPSGGSSQRLPRKLGLPRAMFYLITGRSMSGLEAERVGLAAMTVPPENLATATLELATDIARTDAHALAAMKHMARRALELPLKDGLALERWSQFRYRNESPALQASVVAFAAKHIETQLEKP